MEENLLSFWLDAASTMFYVIVTILIYLKPQDVSTIYLNDLNVPLSGDSFINGNNANKKLQSIQIFHQDNHQFFKGTQLNQQIYDNKKQLRAQIKNRLIEGKFYEIEIIFKDQQYKILKSHQQFLQLQEDIKQGLLQKGLSRHDIPQIDEQFNSKTGQLANIQILQNYLDTLIKNKQYQLVAIFNFLELDKQFPFHKQNQKNQPLRMSDESNDECGGGDVNNDEMGQQEKRISIPYDRYTKNDSDYCLYFDVKVNNYTKMHEAISLVEKPDEKWEIMKRYSDFIKLQQDLETQLKVKVPPLPSKNILHDDSSLSKRKLRLEQYLKVILNEKIYFKKNILLKFIGLKETYYQFFQEFEADEYDLTNFKAKCVEYNIFMSPDENQPYTTYTFSIEQYQPHTNQIISRGFIIRRFREFDSLYKSLEIRFSRCGHKLPQLPAKYTSFGYRTTIDYRKKALEEYLNKLFVFPNICDSFAFRKFINYTPQKNVATSFVSPQNNDKIEEISSLKMDSLKILRGNSKEGNYE